MYFYVLLILRLTGKREIGQLSPFDFVVAIIVAELAARPLEDPNMPLWYGLVPIGLLGLLEVVLSWLTLKSRGLRLFLYGHPQTIIKNGKLLRSEMKKSRYNLDDIMCQLREHGVANIQDVEMGVLECSGKMSIILKSQKRPITPEDLGLRTKYEGLPTILIMDGEIARENLRLIDLDEEWLLQRLREKGLTVDEVLIATISTDGRLFINEKDDGKNNRDK